MAFAWSDVVAVAPELSAASAGTQAAILARVAIEVNADIWGDLATSGMAFLGAHLGTLAARNGAGPLTAERLGEMSRSYGMFGGSVGTTSYGVEYERMIRLLPKAAIGVAV